MTYDCPQGWTVAREKSFLIFRAKIEPQQHFMGQAKDSK
jgi:hypothetical protein